MSTKQRQTLPQTLLRPPIMIWRPVQPLPIASPSGVTTGRVIRERSKLTNDVTKQEQQHLIASKCKWITMATHHLFHSSLWTLRRTSRPQLLPTSTVKVALTRHTRQGRNMLPHVIVYPSLIKCISLTFERITCSPFWLFGRGPWRWR